MARDDAQDAKLREAKRRAGWTMPLEHYYPPTVPAEPSQEAAGTVQASPSALPTYTVEPIEGGCAVIRPRFIGEAGIPFSRNPGQSE